MNSLSSSSALYRASDFPNYGHGFRTPATVPNSEIEQAEMGTGDISRVVTGGMRAKEATTYVKSRRNEVLNSSMPKPKSLDSEQEAPMIQNIEKAQLL